ncbi:tetratricopeptide repeat protein [Bdellovibrionota bacterium FG-1]
MASTPESNVHFNPSVLRNRDDFFSAVYRFFDGLSQHRAAMAVVIALAIAGGVGGTMLMSRHDAQSEAGKNALFIAQKTFDDEMKSLAGVKKPEATPEATKGTKDVEATAAAKRLEEQAYTPLDVDARFPDAVQKFKMVISQYSGTRAGYEARMSLASVYFDHGRAAQALPLLTEAIDAAPSGFEKALALSALGYSQENLGKYAEALLAFEKALNIGEAGIKGDLLLAIARCHEALHDTPKARSTYDRILAELPNTDAAKTAETLKTQL